MIALVLVTVLAGSSQDVWNEAPRYLDSKALAGPPSPDLPAALQKCLAELGPIAAELELAALVCTSPGAILFTRTREEDATWMLHLILHSGQVLREKFALQERPFEPVVTFHFTEQERYGAFLDVLGSRYEYLAAWAPTVKALNGYAIYQPALVALLEDERASRDVSRDNALVHLVGHAMLHQYHGVQPFWLREGVAMDLEVSVLDRLYGFCSSPDFVPIGRPGRWRSDLKKAWRRRTTSATSVLALEPYEVEQKSALRAIGLTRYLVQERRVDLERFLAGIRAEREDHLREDPYHVSDVGTQIEMLAQVLGDDWMQDAWPSLAKGEPRKVVAAQAEWQVGRRRRIHRR